MEDIMKCSKCGIISLQSNFYKKKLTKNSVRSECITCSNFSLYSNQNREKRKFYIKNRIKTEINFRLILNSRRRINHALNGK